jgi:hypothetical protein
MQLTEDGYTVPVSTEVRASGGGSIFLAGVCRSPTQESATLSRPDLQMVPTLLQPELQIWPETKAQCPQLPL